MTQELVYTSAPQGLTPGSRGFCTVAASEELGKRERMKLEGLSAYEFAFNLSDERPERNPTNFLHTQVTFGSERRDVLSRVAYCGADYSNRTNKIAHHLLLGLREQVTPGPAWALVRLARGHFVERWEDDPRPLEDLALKTLVGGGRGGQAGEPLPCDAWAQAAGDAGWGGALARAFYRDPATPAYVVFAPETDLLPLFAESLALLPPEARWRVCFATYYTGLPPDCPCHWRGVLAGSKAHGQVKRFPGATVIDLTAPLGPPDDDVFAASARDGQRLPPADQLVDEPIELVDPGANEPIAPRGHWAQLGIEPPSQRRARDAESSATPWVAVGVVVLAVAIGLALLWPKGGPRRVEVIPKLETTPLAKSITRPTPTPTAVEKTAARKTTAPVAKTEVVAKTAAKTEPVAEQPKETPPPPPKVRRVRLERLPRTLVGEAVRHDLTLGVPDGPQVELPDERTLPSAWRFEIPDPGVTHVLQAPKGAPLRFRRDGEALLVGSEVLEQLVSRFVPIARLSARASDDGFELRLEAVRAGDPDLVQLLPFLVLELLNEKTGALYPVRAAPLEQDRFAIDWSLTKGFVAQATESTLIYPLDGALRLRVRLGDRRTTLDVPADGKARSKWIRTPKDELAFRFVATRDPQRLHLELRPRKLIAPLEAATDGWDRAELKQLRAAKDLDEKGRKRLAKLELSEATVTGLLARIDQFELTVVDAWGLPLRRLSITTRWGLPDTEEGR